MFALLTVLTFLIASMFIGLVATTLSELRHETVASKAATVRRTRR
jgi:hypothetical protein